MGPGDLSRVLAPLPAATDPRLLVGRESFDDAGVFALSESLALVQTVDFFAPIVDDPFDFGRVAAANALSDIYAMGGEPLTALNIVAFPAATLPLSVLTDVLRGGHAMVHSAGAVLVGGHSILDDELKYGLAVTGRADPRRLLTNASARPGDALILTKPIGTGILATAAKGGTAGAADWRAAIDTMCTLNDAASRAAVALGVRCATDITGFGLLGHASHIARGSGVTLRVHAAAVPVLAGAREASAAGARTAGAERNAAFLDGRVDWGSSTPTDRALLTDPQTSGGLLLAVTPAVVADYLSRVDGVVIGTVEPQAARELIVD